MKGGWKIGKGHRKATAHPSGTRVVAKSRAEVKKEKEMGMIVKWP